MSADNKLNALDEALRILWIESIPNANEEASSKELSLILSDNIGPDMNAEKILGSDLLDIIFENRNKEYGAYVLRKQYNHRLGNALLIMMAALAGVIALNYLSVDRSKNRGGLPSVFSIDSAVLLTEIKLHQDPPHPVENKSRPPSSLPQFTVPMIVQSTVVSDSFPVAEEIKGKMTNASVTGGPDFNNENAPVSPTPTPSGNAQSQTKRVIIDNPEIFPEFPGGKTALLRFLTRNLRVPEEAITTPQRVRVTVEFVVDKDGSLSDIQFPSLTDAAFKDEILRVLSKMPKWRPGLQHGKEVAVQFSIPIIFEIPEN